MSEPTCSEGGCDKPHASRGKCGTHYMQMIRESKRTGIPLPPIARRRSRNGLTDEDRFWAKVNKDGPVPARRPELGPCWVWTGATATGYGVFYLNGRQDGAHRAAYELLVGPVPEGLELDHLCHPGDGSCPRATCPHRLCVNPAHLEPVTRLTNMERGNTFTAANLAVTHCPKGHEYTPENTRIRIARSGNQSRHCKKCRA